MIVNNRYLGNVGKISGNTPAAPIQKPVHPQGAFKDVLQNKMNSTQELKFSKHAEMRLQTRNIQLSQAQKEKISSAVDRAQEKGVKDSLVLLDDIALVVSVKNKTVITAVSSGELKENVFTNIDGAVFA